MLLAVARGGDGGGVEESRRSGRFVGNFRWHTANLVTLLALDQHCSLQTDRQTLVHKFMTVVMYRHTRSHYSKVY